MREGRIRPRGLKGEWSGSLKYDDMTSSLYRKSHKKDKESTPLTL